MSPDYDFTLIQLVYQDVMRLFHGDYPGYSPIKTLYHDLPHTLEVLLCGVRLMHGVHVSGDRLTDEEISLIVIAILMHDVGYAQRKGEESGTGAQHTQTHVQRGIEFMLEYFFSHKLLERIPVAVTAMMLGTEHNRPFAQICFSDERSRMLGRIVATADITRPNKSLSWPENSKSVEQLLISSPSLVTQDLVELLVWCQPQRLVMLPRF